MNTSRKAKCMGAGVIASLVALMSLYVGLYFLVLSLPPGVHLPRWLSADPHKARPAYIEISGEWNRYPDYRGLPEWLFAPIHQCDRTHLRPSLWSGKHPRNQELSFEWLIREGPFDAMPTRK